MIRAEHTLRHRPSTSSGPRQPRYILHCLTATRHYVWTRRPVTYAEARLFVLKAKNKRGRYHWFEEA